MCVLCLCIKRGVCVCCVCVEGCCSVALGRHQTEAPRNSGGGDFAMSSRGPVAPTFCHTLQYCIPPSTVVTRGLWPRR